MVGAVVVDVRGAESEAARKVGAGFTRGQGFQILVYLLTLNLIYFEFYCHYMSCFRTRRDSRLVLLLQFKLIKSLFLAKIRERVNTVKRI